MDDNTVVDDPPYVKVFARAPIYDLVFACLSPCNLVRLALTCRAAFLAVAEFKRRAFNINRHFSRYFTDPIAFRSLQAGTSTLVSGSNALQFLDRTFYPEADLDLYTHPGHSFEVAQFLVEKEGYSYVPRGSQAQDWQKETKGDWDGTRRRVDRSRIAEHAYPDSDIHAVWTFEKTGVDGASLTVQIIEASSSPLETILGFHSTCVMNFITSDAAYSLYPVATFERRCSLGMPSSRRSPQVIRKYIQRGWRIYFMPTPADEAKPNIPPFLLSQVRWVADAHTWVLPLDRTGVQARLPLSQASVPLPFDPALLNGWRMSLSVGKATDGYRCQYYPVRATMFRYNYAIPEERVQLAIRDWTILQGRHTHSQVSREDWVWFDADLPGFLGRT